MKRIDTHQHLWDCRQFPYAWCAGIPALNKSFLLEDYLLAAEGGGIEKTVFVECNVDAPYIEDLPPLHDIEVTLQLPVKSARLVPQGGGHAREIRRPRDASRAGVFLSPDDLDRVPSPILQHDQVPLQIHCRRHDRPLRCTR